MLSTAEKVIDSSLKSLGPKFYAEYLRRILVLRWDSIVDEKISARIRPIRVEHRTLFVSIESAAWRAEFQFKKPSIIKALNAAVDFDLIEEIMITRGTIEPERTPKKLIGPLDLREPTAEEIIQATIKDFTLDEDELREIDRELEDREEGPLKEVFRQTQISRRRLEKCRLAHGWHKCAKCSLLVPPDETLCFNCYRSGKN